MNSKRDENSDQQMFVVLSVVVGQRRLHLLCDPLFQIVALAHELVKFLRAVQFHASTAAFVLQLRDLRLQVCLVTQQLGYRRFIKVYQNNYTQNVNVDMWSQYGTLFLLTNVFLMDVSIYIYPFLFPRYIV